MKPKIVFRINAGKIYGYGHLTRNIALAEAFNENNCEIKFLIKTEVSQDIIRFVSQKTSIKFKTQFLNKYISRDEDIKIISDSCQNEKCFLILDNYDHDYYYYINFKKHGIKWAQFDYKINNKILADIIINPNIGVKKEDYQTIVSNESKLCIGEKYVIIRNELLSFKKNENKKNLLLSFGGGSYRKSIVDTLNRITNYSKFNYELLTNDSLIKEKNNLTIHLSPNNISDIYSRCRLAIVSSGVISQELAFYKIPMVLVPISENQEKNAKLVASSGFGISFNSINHFNEYLQKKTLYELIKIVEDKYNPQIIVDGKGANRITEKVLNTIDI